MQGHAGQKNEMGGERKEMKGKLGGEPSIGEYIDNGPVVRAFFKNIPND
jgi:hypothetical protein